MFHQMRLGRVDADLPDNLPTLDQHPIASAVAPAQLVRNRVAYRPQLDGNDLCGDCTCVALANAIRAQAALAGWQVEIPTERVIDLYRTVGGYPRQDEGVVEVDLLAYQARHGFDAGGQTRYVGLWANVPADDFNMIALVMARMGTAYLGVNLAKADQQGGGVWDTNTPAAMGDSMPGSWGGHALLAYCYDGLEDDSIWELVTWGYRQRATLRWLKSRLSEAHALYHPQMLGPNGCNAAGINRDQLAADVASFAGR